MLEATMVCGRLFTAPRDAALAARLHPQPTADGTGFSEG